MLLSSGNLLGMRLSRFNEPLSFSVGLIATFPVCLIVSIVPASDSRWKKLFYRKNCFQRGKNVLKTQSPLVTTRPLLMIWTMVNLIVCNRIEWNVVLVYCPWMSMQLHRIFFLNEMKLWKHAEESMCGCTSRSTWQRDALKTRPASPAPTQQTSNQTIFHLVSLHFPSFPNPTKPLHQQQERCRRCSRHRCWWRISSLLKK